MPEPSPERVADHFVTYLFTKYAGGMHVKRVASWIGLLAIGISKLKDRWWFNRERQLVFEVGTRRYKARYEHTLGPRGGIEIVEIGKSPGSPDVRPVHAIISLADAVKFYDHPTV